MIDPKPVESYGELAERFPGIDQLDPTALGRFAFHAAKHFPPEDFQTHQTGESFQEWHADIDGVLGDVRWWQLQQQSQSRVEMAQDITQNALRLQEVHSVYEALETSPADEAYNLVANFLEKEGCYLQTNMASSPMFPEGRTAKTTLQDARDPKTGKINIPYGSTLVTGTTDEAHTRLYDYIKDEYPHKKAGEMIKAELEQLGTVDSEKLAELSAQYGAKAAGLLSFKEKVEQLDGELEHSGYRVSIEVPAFLPVGVDMYQSWLSGQDTYEAMLESVRSQATQLIDRHFGESAELVAVRSSAVKSEDGDMHTGAGVYKSVVVDPKDKQAFQHAVEEVYASARSEDALSYQHGIGVSDEMMGLVIQQYQEALLSGGRHDDMFYGHANSSGANPNLIDVHTNEGTLLYDKRAVLEQLLNEVRSEGEWNALLHTDPDHDSSLRHALIKIRSIPHAVAFAEKIFGKPMQLEFANDTIVQVRPLHVETADNAVKFPEDLESIADCAASGTGDMELERLDEDADNSEKTGFVRFWREYEFSMKLDHAGYDAFPKEGAVIIMKPSSSGHIQAICREKGLMCFYPRKGEYIDHLEHLMVDDSDGRQEPREIKLRFIADGYDGRIYEV